MKITFPKTRTRSAQPLLRAGFSLIELMIVIVIIGILMAILLPAVGNARRAATVAQVTVDIKAIEKGIADFELKFGVTPPSFIRLHETGSNWSNSDPETRQAIAFIRQAWPNFDFSLDRDINGDKLTTSTLDLNGSECLFFFLGGVCATKDKEINDPTGVFIVESDGTNGAGGVPVKGWIPLGFSTNSTNPFARSTGNRVGPFYEFLADRIKDKTGTLTSFLPEMFDPIVSQQMPYVYMSSYGSRGYQVADLPSGGTSSLGDIYRLGGSALTDPPHKPKTYQIISPGFDGEFGVGGEFNGEKLTDAARRDEWDNITNFSGGTLN